MRFLDLARSIPNKRTTTRLDAVLGERARGVAEHVRVARPERDGQRARDDAGAGQRRGLERHDAGAGQLDRRDDVAVPDRGGGT